MSITPTSIVSAASPESVTIPKIEAPTPAAPPVQNAQNVEAEKLVDADPASIPEAAQAIVGREPIHMPPAKEEAPAQNNHGPIVLTPQPQAHPAPSNQELAAALMTVAKHLNLPQAVAHPPQPSLVVTPDAFKKAEQNLAAFVGSKIPSKNLTEGLVLTLGNEIDANNPDLTDVTLAFSGPMVAPNLAELHKELMGMFNTHPQLGAQFKEQHNANTYYDDKGEATLHLSIPGMPTEQYVKMIQAIASPTVATYHLETPVTPHEVVESKLGNGSTKLPEGMTILNPSPQAEPEKKEIRQEAATAETPAQALSPSLTLAKPIINDGKVNGLNMQLAPTV